MNPNFDFANPELLWLLLLLPIIALLKGKAGASGTLIFSSVAIAKKVAKKNKSRAGGILTILRILTIALLIIGLARPRLGKGFSEREESGIDIMLAVDVSSSMSALDLSNNNKILTRLDAVKDVIRDFIKKRPNDRIGMVVFGANTFMVSPLTLSHDWLDKNIDRIELGLIDGSATAIGKAIVSATNRMRDLKNAKSRVIILLSDGENNAGNISPIAAAEAAASFDTKIYTIAAGASGNVPFAKLDRLGRVVKDRKGNPIPASTFNSNIDEDSLKKIADLTNGKFYRARDFNNLKNIYSQIDKLEKTNVKIHNFTEYTELFFYPVILALALLILERFLANTRYRTLP